MLRKLICLALVSAASAIAGAQTATEQVLYSFSGGAGPATDGISVQSADSNFYGATVYQGNSACGGGAGCGSVFRFSSADSLTTLFAFCDPNVNYCSSTPEGQLVQGSDGSFYGTTASGGDDSAGTIFRITPGGAFSTLHSFNDSDGQQPEAGLIEGNDGNFYGTTLYGGSSSSCAGGCGTVFRITPSGDFTSLYSFSGYSAGGGGNPRGALLQASDGYFYGTTYQGGSGGCSIDNDGYSYVGCGTVFKISSSGVLTTIYNFTGGADGQSPIASLVEGQDGRLYGTAFGGQIVGSGVGYGTIFGLTTSGSLSTLYTFTGGSDGSPENTSGLLLAGNGIFYGATNNGGLNGEGSVYQLTSAGDFTTIYSFCSLNVCEDGQSPYSTPMIGSDGALYGSTYFGGANNVGALYRISFTPALPAPVQISLSSSTVSPGASVAATFQVLNAFSLTMQQCYAFSSYNGGTMSPLGKVTGTLTKNIYTGSATFTAGAQGTYNFALTCGGVESGFATLTVAGQPTTTAIVANPNPPTVGQQVLLTAQVRRTSGGGFATGQVKFQSGSTYIGTSTLNAYGVATFTASTNGLTPGTYPVTATYEGDSTDAASTSPSLPVTLNKAPTTVTLTANPTSVTPPGTVALQATVTRSTSGATGAPGGSVTFSAGTLTIATVTVNSSGVANYSASTSGISAGNYTVVANYNGDGSDTASTSSGVVVTVK